MADALVEFERTDRDEGTEKVIDDSKSPSLRQTDQNIPASTTQTNESRPG
jgi:hypothetical protein